LDTTKSAGIDPTYQQMEGERTGLEVFGVDTYDVGVYFV
jgi:hypothetical protein